MSTAPRPGGRDTPNVPCKYFLLGTFRRGGTCAFKHDKGTQQRAVAETPQVIQGITVGSLVDTVTQALTGALDKASQSTTESNASRNERGASDVVPPTTQPIGVRATSKKVSIGSAEAIPIVISRPQYIVTRVH